MYKVLMCCAMGASSSFFETRMKKYINENGIEMSLVSKSVNDVKRLLQKEHYDCLLLAPQASFHKKLFEDKYKDMDIVIDVIAPADYGAMDGEKVVKQILEKLEKKEDD